MNWLLLNAAPGSKIEQALEKLVDFGMDAGKDIFVAILIYSIGRFIIRQISILIAKVLEKRKIEDECSNDFERWIYVLKHMDTLDRMPFKARKAVFERLEKMASKANMTPEERAQYEKEWKVYNDYFNTLDFAEQKGMLRGKESSARMMKSKGLAIDLISECTGLTAEEIEAL